jgi:hypothetical protein
MVLLMTEEQLEQLVDGRGHLLSFGRPVTRKLTKSEQSALDRAKLTGYLDGPRLSEPLQWIWGAWCDMWSIPSARIEGGGKWRKLTIDMINTSERSGSGDSRLTPGRGGPTPRLSRYHEQVLLQLLLSYLPSNRYPRSPICGFYTAFRLPAQHATAAMEVAGRRPVDHAMANAPQPNCDEDKRELPWWRLSTEMWMELLGVPRRPANHREFKAWIKAQRAADSWQSVF